MESTEEEKIVAEAKEKTKELHDLLSAKDLDYDKFFELIVKRSKNFDRQIMVDEYQEQFSENLFDGLILHPPLALVKHNFLKIQKFHKKIGKTELHALPCQ